jgi:O-antigen ligase
LDESKTSEEIRIIKIFSRAKSFFLEGFHDGIGHAFWLSAAVQLSIVILLFLVPYPTIFAGGCLTVVLGALILFEPKSVFFVTILITFLFHPDLVGREYIVKILGVNWYAMDWILLFSWISWFVRFSMGNAPRMQKSFLTIPIFLYLIMLLIFSLISIQQGNALQDIFADLRLFFYYISFWLVMLYARNTRDIENIFWLTIILGMCGAIPEVVRSLLGSGYDSLSGHILFFKRITGPHEINYALMLVASIVIFPYMHTVEKKTILMFCIVISTIALFLSYTRGSWLAAIVGLVSISFIFVKQIKITRILAVICLIGTTFLILDVLGIFTLKDVYTRSTLVSADRIDLSSFQRILEWRMAYDIFLAHPLVGAGLGFVYRFYVPMRGALEQTYIHNSFFYVLSKMGSIGFSIMMSVFITALYVGIRTFKRMEHDTEKGLMLAFLSMIIVFLAKSMTSWHLNTLTTSLYLGMILGVIAALNAQMKTKMIYGDPMVEGRTDANGAPSVVTNEAPAKI